MRLVPIAVLAALCLSACVCTPKAPPILTGDANDTSANGDEAALEHATLTSIDDSTRYRVSGPQGLDGTLTFDGRQWILNAAFEFPTAGYTVKELDIAVLKRLPEKVHIVIPYQPPPVDALVAQAVAKGPVTWSGSVSTNATFTIDVKRIPPQSAANTGLE